MRKPYLVIDNHFEKTRNYRKPYVVSGENNTSQYISTVKIDAVHNINANEPAFWLVDMKNEAEGRKLIQKLRQHASPHVYLRPVVIYNANETTRLEIINSVDGKLATSISDNQELASLTINFEPVNQWIDNIPDAVTPADTNIAFRVLRLIASRDKELAPITTVHSIYGYIYPLLSPLFVENDNSVFKTLEFLHDQHLLISRFVCNSHCCGYCESAFLNFRETCPYCGTDDIVIEQLVHHFKCAYIGEISTFKQDNTLVCPKCDKELRHIGVDYDKPSVVYKCHQCNHDFQEPSVTTTCYNCGHSNDPEQQVIRKVQAYGVSAIGKSAANFGMDSLFTRILETELGLFSFNVFKEFYRVEIARIKRYNVSTSVLVMIEFKDIEKLYLQLGRRAREVFSELSQAFQAVLRESDIISSRNESLFCVIMTETNLSQAQRAIERLEENISALLDTNLQYTSTLHTQIILINENKALDQLLEDFLDNDTLKDNVY